MRGGETEYSIQYATVSVIITTADGAEPRKHEGHGNDEVRRFITDSESGNEPVCDVDLGSAEEAELGSAEEAKVEDFAGPPTSNEGSGCGETEDGLNDGGSDNAGGGDEAFEEDPKLAHSLQMTLLAMQTVK